MMKMPVMISACRRYGSRSHSGTEANATTEENGDRLLHPTRSVRAKSPVGLKIRTAMMSRKPMASR